jgi:predicted  nucleic acid-binding Zn-ribbon protein
MGKVYQSVRGVVQGTLHRRKPDIMVSARAKGNDGSLNDAMEELEKSFVDGIARLKAAVSDDQAVVASAAQHAEQVIEGLRANITVLEAKLRETQDTVHRKDVASQKMEESLNTEIRDLQSVVKKKEEALESRDSEVNDLKSKIDVQVEQVTHLELAIQQAKGVAASAAQHAEQVIEGLKAYITVLEAKLREAEDTVHRKDVASQKMEESLNTEIRDLQSVVKKKEEALESRDFEVNDLKSKIDVQVEQVTHLELAIQQAKGVAASAAQHAEQVIEGLKANITVLEAKLKETEDTVHRKDVASQKMEETLSTEIRDLQSVVKKKEALESRDSEVNDFKSKIAVLVEQVTRLELAIQQAKGEAASEAQHAAQVIESLKAKSATLETQLTQTEQIVGGTDGTIKGLDQDRDRQVIDLKAELEPQTNGIKEISSFFSKAETLVDIQAQDKATVVAGEQLKTGEEKPPTSHFQAARVTSIVTEAARETVSQEVFDRMIAEFSKLTNVIGSIASLIVRDHVKALGESMEKFPQTRLTELLKSLSGEISDDKRKADFRQRFGKV